MAIRLGLPGRHRPRRGDPQYVVWEFIHDIDVSRFTGTGWWLLTTVVAVGAAWVAAQAGVPAGLAIVAVGTLLLLAAPVLLEQRRWHAQDVLYWYQLARVAEWVRDTGGQPVPYFDVAGNEVWLGAHQPGTVPQVYRAHAAEATGDPDLIAREIAALPETTPVERAQRLWVLAGTWDKAAEGDLTELRTVVAALPEGQDRILFEAYLAHVDSLKAHRAGSPAWLGPMAAIWPAFPRQSLGPWRTFRLVLSRFVAAVWFAVFGTLFVFTLSPLWAPTIPAAYVKTEMASRGDLPKQPSDWNQVWLALPAVADALPAARRTSAALEPWEWSGAIDAGLPTVIWDVHTIELAGPQDQPGRHVAQLEILLGSSSAQHGWVLVTFETVDGPTYAYDLSPAAVRTLQDVLGVPPLGGS